jgi:Mg-chelatase subunit ChlI
MQQAWEAGGLLIVNEIDHASEDVSNMLHAILDNPEVATISLPDHDAAGNPVTIRPAEGFRCIATMNGFPEDLAPAVLDRFSVRIAVWEPSEKMYGALSDDLAEVCRQLYDAVRNSHDGEPQTTYRQMRRFAVLEELYAGRGMSQSEATERAAVLVHGNPREAAMLIESVRGERFRRTRGEVDLPDAEAAECPARRPFGTNWRWEWTPRENKWLKEHWTEVVEELRASPERGSREISALTSGKDVITVIEADPAWFNATPQALQPKVIGKGLPTNIVQQLSSAKTELAFAIREVWRRHDGERVKDGVRKAEVEGQSELFPAVEPAVESSAA